MKTPALLLLLLISLNVFAGISVAPPGGGAAATNIQSTINLLTGNGSGGANDSGIAKGIVVTNSGYSSSAAYLWQVKTNVLSYQYQSGSYPFWQFLFSNSVSQYPNFAPLMLGMEGLPGRLLGGIYLHGTNILGATNGLFNCGDIAAYDDAWNFSGDGRIFVFRPKSWGLDPVTGFSLGGYELFEAFGGINNPDDQLAYFNFLCADGSTGTIGLGRINTYFSSVDSTGVHFPGVVTVIPQTSHTQPEFVLMAETALANTNFPGAVENSNSVALYFCNTSTNRQRILMAWTNEVISGNGSGLTNVQVAASNVLGQVSWTQLPPNVMSNNFDILSGTFSGTYNGNGAAITNIPPTGVYGVITNVVAVDLTGVGITNLVTISGGTATITFGETNEPYLSPVANQPTNTFTGPNIFSNVTNSFTGSFVGNGSSLTNLTSLVWTNSAAGFISSGVTTTVNGSGWVLVDLAVTNSQIVWLTNQTSHICRFAGNTTGVWTNYDSLQIPASSGDVVLVTNISGSGGASLISSFFSVLK